MARNGLKILDSDMHVFEPHDLYLKYMNTKWGDRVPRAEPRKRHGQVKFKFGDGRPLRVSGIDAIPAAPKTDARVESSPGEAKVAQRYEKSFRRDYDPVSQLEAMDDEGLDVAVLFRTFPLHCDDSLEPEYANDLCRAWNNWIADFCKENNQRLKPSALITLHDIDMAVDETRRAVKELGAVERTAYSRPHLRSAVGGGGAARRSGLLSSGGESQSRASRAQPCGSSQRRRARECLPQSHRADVGRREILRRRSVGEISETSRGISRG